jgi:hypothetical protein
MVPAFSLSPKRAFTSWAHKCTYGSNENFRFNRLDKVSVRARFEPAHLMLGENRRRRDMQNSHSRSARVLAQALADVKSAHIGEIDVEKNQNGLVPFRQLKRFLTGTGFDYGKSSLS